MSEVDMYYICFLECYKNTNNKIFEEYFLTYFQSMELILEYENMKKNKDLKAEKCKLNICKKEDYIHHNYCFHNFLLYKIR